MTDPFDGCRRTVVEHFPSHARVPSPLSHTTVPYMSGQIAHELPAREFVPLTDGIPAEPTSTGAFYDGDIRVASRSSEEHGELTTVEISARQSEWGSEDVTYHKTYQAGPHMSSHRSIQQSAGPPR